MSLADRINTAILSRLLTRTRADGAGFALHLTAIDRLVAITAPGYVPVMMLIGDLPDGRILVADEEDAYWPALIVALDAGGRAAMPSSEWTLRLTADLATPIVLIGTLDPPGARP